jgi:transcriptional regulator with XRE-family HTH domain
MHRCGRIVVKGGDYMTIGDRIRQRRNELMWSQRDLAAKMGYNNNSTITRIESGKVDIPQSRIMQFADVLGVSVAYLMGWEEMHQKNDIITDAVVRMRSDEEFLTVVGGLLTLDADKMSAVKQLLLALQK